MTIFWSISAAMILAALALLASALRSQPYRDVTSSSESNSADEDQSSPSIWPTAVVIFIGLPVLAIILYSLLGAPELIGVAAQTPAADRQTQSSGMHSVTEMVARLAARLQQEPDDAEGWMMLGRSYLVLQKADEAAVAFARAHALLGDQAQLLADYAQALALADNDKVGDKAARLIARALQLQPDNQKALWLAGVAAMHRGDNLQASEYWRRLSALLPPGSQEAQILGQHIARTGVSVPAAESEPAAVDVSVALHPDLRDRVGPEDTVFIFARAVQGPRAPLAVVRKQVRDLPLTVRLDDSKAMSANFRLSLFAEVIVEARISRSGDALPRSGDLQSRGDRVLVGADNQIDIVIAQILP